MATEARLYREDDTGVLWLTAGRSELALSIAGIWLHVGRRTEDLPWAEISQVQRSDVRRDRASVEVFITRGASRRIGPFPAAKAEQWVRAAGAAASQAGLEPLPLQGSPGFALLE
jgi:hypothetical protein